MSSYFDQLAMRESYGNMKWMVTPREVTMQDGITFCGAEMDFRTAPPVIEALVKRAQNGLYGYTLADEHYLVAVVGWMKRRRAWDIRQDWIIPTNGTLHSIATAIRAFTKPGDGVIIHNPVYMLYERMISNNGRTIVRNELLYRNGSYDMDFAELERLMADPQNKMFILCNPHNPIAKVWNDSYLKELLRLARKHQVMVISDEIFAEIVFDGHRTTPLLQHADLEDDVIVLTSIGKSFNFTGFSHANAIIAKEELRSKFNEQKRIDHYGSLNPFIRDAVIAAYTEGDTWFDEMLQYVAGNISYVQQFLQQHMPSIQMTRMEGTYLAWMDWSALDLSEQELQHFLLVEAGLDLDQGASFGSMGRGFTRMNLATPRKELVLALERLKQALQARTITYKGEAK